MLEAEFKLMSFVNTNFSPFRLAYPDYSVYHVAMTLQVKFQVGTLESSGFCWAL